MNSKTKILFASLGVLTVTLACVSMMGKPPTTVTSPDELTFPLPTPTSTPTPIACPVITDEAIRLALVENETSHNHILDENVLLVSYSIANDELTKPNLNPFATDFKELQRDRETHTKVWNYFRAIVPAERRDFLKEYIVITDGESGIYAAVGQTEDAADEWALLVDIVDTENNHQLTYTFIHEYAHLLTLGPDQVPPNLEVFKNQDDSAVYFEALADCFTYFTGEGCSNPGSYMDDYYNAFWLDIYDEWNRIEFESDEQEYYEALEGFYEKYKDRFVTDYAVTRPEEDIAESFSFFILGPKPAGDTIAEQKILFFYQRPELVALREELLENICTNFPQ